MSNFRPMKSAHADLSKLKFPLLLSPKLDGVRAVVLCGKVLSSTLKPIPNRHVQEKFGHLEYFDGELILGDPTDPLVCNKTVSAVMTKDGTPDVDFYVFDHVKNPDLPFQERSEAIDHVTKVPQYLVENMESLLSMEHDLVENQGYEGVMLRSLTGRYKYGRSTVNEGYILKLKQFIDAEFEIVDFVEQMHNGNEATTDNLGRTARSTHKENKTAKGTLGSIVCRYGDSTFECGTGFSDDLRQLIWDNRQDYMGKRAKIKYFAVGMKYLPRHPVFLGFRHELDM